MRTVYLIGYPGAGKSSAMAAALAHLVGLPLEGRLPMVTYHRRGERDTAAVQLGRVRPGGFCGTDALSLGIQPVAVQWVTRGPVRLAVAEGDRLANDGFFTAAAEAGQLQVVLLEVAPELARERAQARAAALGRRAQSPAWVAGRVTKVDGLAERWRPIRLDGRCGSVELGSKLREVMEL